MYNVCVCVCVCVCGAGEKLTDEDVDILLQGIEDSQGQVNYEGIYTNTSAVPINAHHCSTDVFLCSEFVKTVLAG